MSRVNFSVKNGIGFVTMNDPAHLNPLDIAMDDELLENFKRCEEAPEVKAVVLAGAGRAFSAGGDMRFFREQLDARAYENLDAVLFHVNRLVLFMKRMRKLIIAAVQGHAAGGGACLMLASDFVIADETMKFSVPFTKIGLAPDAGCMYLLSRAAGARRALEICVENPVIGAAECKALSLVTKVVPAGEALPAAETLAEKLAAGPLFSYELAKRQNYAACYADFEAYLAETEKETVGAAFRSQDFEESVRAFLGKRKPEYKGK